MADEKEQRKGATKTWKGKLRDISRIPKIRKKQDGTVAC